MHMIYNGVSSATLGMYLAEEPTITQPERQVDTITVPGRAGEVIIDKGGLKDVKTELKCYIRDVAKLPQAMAYLTGSGKLTISTDAGHEYRAYFPGGAEADRLIRNLAAREITVPVRLKPYRYRIPEAADITLTTGGIVANPGTAKSAPRIAITCTGTGTLYIGTAYSIDLEGLTGGCIVDTDAMDVYAMDGITPMYSGVSMEDFPFLAPGNNNISWTGDISGVKITPRWRDL